MKKIVLGEGQIRSTYGFAKHDCPIVSLTDKQGYAINFDLSELWDERVRLVAEILPKKNSKVKKK